MTGSEPLLQEAIPRKARSHAKVLALSFMLASLGCGVVLWGQLDSKELRPTLSELVTRMASANIQSRSWQPARFANVGVSKTWAGAGRSSPIAGSSSNEARAWIDNWKKSQEPSVALEEKPGEEAEPMTMRRPVQVAPTWVGFGMSGVGSWDQDSLRRVMNERIRAKKKGFTYATYAVKALRECTANGANVPVDTLGTLESSVIVWENGEITTDARRSVDYEILKKNKPGTDLVGDDPKFGQEVSAEDLQKAYSDLSGMFRGDLVAVMRPNGKWMYAYAVAKSGFSNTGGAGLMLEFRLPDVEREGYAFKDWDKVKQLREPQADRGWKTLSSPLTNPQWQQKLAKDGELTSATFTVKALRLCTANGANVPVDTLGTLARSVIMWDNGENTTNAKLGVDYQIIKEVALAKRDIVTKKEKSYDARYGQEVSAEDLKNAYADLSGMFTGDLVAAMRSDGKWTYAIAVEKTGFSRTGTAGLQLTIKFPGGNQKQYPYNDWGMVKQLRKPQGDRGWGTLPIPPPSAQLPPKPATDPGFTVKALRPVTANGANVPVGSLGTLEKYASGKWLDETTDERGENVIMWDNGEKTTDALRGVDYEILKTAPGMSEEGKVDKRFGQQVSAEDLKNAFSDLSGVFAGDLLAVMRSDGNWTYAYAVAKSGFSRTGSSGLSLTVKFADGGRKQYPFNDFDKVRQLTEPDGNRGWGKVQSLVTNPLLVKIGEKCAKEDMEKATADPTRIVPGDVVAAIRSDGNWTYAFVENRIGTTRSGGAGTGVLLRVDNDGGEKKVMSSELKDKVKAFKA